MPDPAQYAAFTAFVRDVICADEPPHIVDALWDWMGYLAAYPGLPSPWALSLRSPEGGTGKNLYFSVLASLFSPAHSKCAETSIGATGRFNDELNDLVLLAFNEAAFAGTRATWEMLKAWVTEPTRESEQKYRSRRTVLNSLTVMVLSNNDHAINIDGESLDRRWFALRVGGAYLLNKRRFADVAQVMDSPERRSHLLGALQTRGRRLDLHAFSLPDSGPANRREDDSGQSVEAAARAVPGCLP